MPAEKLALRKEIAELKAEVEFLKAQLNSVMLLLKMEQAPSKILVPTNSKTGRASN
jgi:hypothetical protein